MTGTKPVHDPDRFFERAVEALASGDLHRARSELMKAFQYGKDPGEAALYLELSEAFSKKELWREAEECLLEALRVSPESERARRMLDALHEEPDRFMDIRPHFDAEEVRRREADTPLSSVPRIQLFLELTNQCNGKCITCLNRKMKRERGIMDFDLFRKIVDESAANLYLEMVHLYGVGEVFLVPDVTKYFDYALRKYARKGIRTCLITNGERITDLPFGLSAVDISFNAGRKGSFERITGMNYERTVRNIWRLEREGQLGGNTSIHMLVFEENQDEVDGFKKLFAYTSADLVLAYKFDNQCGDIEDRTLPAYRSEGKIPCHYVRDVLNIAWNGDVILCPHDFEGVVNYGSLKDHTLEELWYSERHQRKLEDHAACKFDGLCKDCNFNVPIEGKNVVVPRSERIALRKAHAAYAMEEMVRCPRGASCEIFRRYVDRIDEIEAGNEGLVSVCAEDYRFYGIDVVMDERRYPHCPGLRRLRDGLKRSRLCWEAPTFGPSGYAFAARGYLAGLDDLRTRVRAQPVWADCDTEFVKQGGRDG